MFERSLVISQGNHASAGQRWTAIVSVTVQVGLAGLLIALPLLHPESLAFHTDSPKALLPSLKVPKVRPVTMDRVVPGTSSIPTMPATLLVAPGTIPHGVSKDEGPPVQAFTGMGNPGGLPEALGLSGSEPARVTVVPARPSGAPVRISKGVSAGLLMTPIRPVYPAIAKAAHVEGIVVVEATISKSGMIESLHVTSGPEMLRASALDAIRTARYQPYRLNGEPTEVQTTITVSFRIGG